MSGPPAPDGDRRRRAAALAAARRRAFRPEAYAGQESFVSTAELRALAGAAGITSTSRVLDLCCGVGGPGRVVARATGCRLVGVDRGIDALVLAREATTGGGARFVSAEVPRLPFRSATFDVVLLIETFLAFRDPRPLCAAVAGLLVDGGRFAFTCEEGTPLDATERAAMPESDTVWLSELATLRAHLAAAGLAVRSIVDHTSAHAALARRLGTAFADDRTAIATALGVEAVETLLVSHALWAEWLERRRVRKLAVVCERRERPVL